MRFVGSLAAAVFVLIYGRFFDVRIIFFDGSGGRISDAGLSYLKEKP